MNINSFNFNRFVHPRSGFLQETFVFVEACCASDGWLIHVTIFLFTRTAGSYKGWFGWFNRMEVLVHPQEWFCRSLLCERLVVHTRDDVCSPAQRVPTRDGLVGLTAWRFWFTHRGGFVGACYASDWWFIHVTIFCSPVKQVLTVCCVASVAVG